MIKTIFFICSKSFLKNELFNLKSSHNRDNCLYPYYLLKQYLSIKGISLNTYDYFNKNINEPYSLIFFDFPKNIDYYLKNYPNSDKFLFIYESPIKNPANQIIENHKYFKKIFTWNSIIVDNKKYFKLNYAMQIPTNTPCVNFKNKKLCAAIFGHKLQSHKLELYSERINAIKWFQNNHLEDFDLYGEGWNKYYFKNKLFHLNRFQFLTKLLKPNFPFYKGPVKSKIETYKNYKFALCFENAKFPNYVTEKIFDCFFARCVPIYLGAPNITTFIPQNTFIDKRQFKTYDELYNFLTNINEETYNKYLENIKNFIKSDKIIPFSAEYFASTIMNEIIKK